MLAGKSHIFIHVESHDVGKGDFAGLVHLYQLLIDSDG